MPDVLLDYEGLSVVVEGKRDTGPEAGRQVQQQAYQRVVDQGFHMALAVLYPLDLEQMPQDSLADALARARLRVAVFAEYSDPTTPWEETTGEGVGDLLHRGYERLLEAEVVKGVVQVIDRATDQFSLAFLGNQAALEKAMTALGIRALPTGREPDNEDREDEEAEE